MQSYTQPLSGPYINLGKHENQQLPQQPPQEHGVVALPDEVFDPFSEDEVDILVPVDGDEAEEPCVHHTNNQQHEHKIPPEHFFHFPPK